MYVDPLVPSNPEYLGQETLQVRVAPIKRAFLVESGNVQQASLAFMAAAAIWGGARCPILPLDDDGTVAPLWLQVAEVMDVSQVIDFTSKDSVAETWAARSTGKWSVLKAQPLDDAEFWNVHPLAVLPEPGRVREMFVAQDDSLLSLAGGGGYGLDEEIPLFREAGFGVVSDSDDAMLARAQIGGRTALEATLMQVGDTTIRGGSMYSLAMLWVTNDRNSFSDAIWFWNLRATRPRFSRPRPMNVLTTAQVASSPEFAKEFRAGLRHTSRTEPEFVLLAPEISDAERSAIAANLGAVRHAGSKVSERPFRPQTMEATAPKYLENQDPLQFWLVPRAVGNPATAEVQLRRPDVAYRVDSPVEWDPSHVMTGRVDLLLSSSFITGPRRGEVAALYRHVAEWEDDRLRIRTNNVPDYFQRLTLPTPQQVLEASVRSSGLTYAVSDKAKQVLGVAGSHDLQLYRQSATVFVIRQMTAKPGRDLARELKEIRECGSVNESSLETLRISSLLGHRPTKTLEQLRAEAAEASLRNQLPGIMDELVARGGAEMGLVTTCPLCGLVDFEPLRDATGAALCSGCGSRAAYKAAGSSGSPQMHYRLSSLLHTLSLNGGLVPLAVVALMSSERAYVLPGADLSRDGDRVGEVDLLGWMDSRLFAGEAKSSTAGFDLADIERDVSKAAQLRPELFIAACLEVISDSVRERLTEACARHSIELRILDGTELLVEPVVS